MPVSTTAASPSREPIHLLHLVPGNLYGGVETILVALARYRDLCPEMRHSFLLCYKGRLSQELRAEGADVTFVPSPRLSRPWTVVRARRALSARLKECPCQVVVSHHVWPLVVFGPALSRWGRPVCVYLHGPTNRHSWLNRLAARCQPDQLVAVSKDTLRSFRPVFPGTPAEVIYNLMPWQTSAFELSDSQRSQLRLSLDTPADSVVILQASRVEIWKGQDILLDGLQRLLDLPNWMCWIAGGTQQTHEAEFYAGIKRQCNRLGLDQRVRFLGERTDVHRLMGAADIYCQANRGPEGCSMAFLEAFSAGLPIVTSAIGGAPEMIDDRCGRLLPVNDPAALSVELRALIQNPGLRRQLGAAAVQRARQLSEPAQQLERLRRVVTNLQTKSRVRCA